MDAIQFDIKGIKCDACPYEDDTAKFDDYDKFLNKPCPECGANLLTQEDLDTVKAMMTLAGAINKQIGPCTEENPTMATVAIHMDGTGKINPELIGINKGPIISDSLSAGGHRDE